MKMIFTVIGKLHVAENDTIHLLHMSLHGKREREKEQD